MKGIISIIALAVAFTAGSARAQTMCATSIGTCVVNGIGQPGGPCFCFTPGGPVQGVIPGGGGYVPQVGDPFPHFCCTPAGRLGPYANASLPAGQLCHGTLPNGVVMMGQACY